MIGPCRPRRRSSWQESPHAFPGKTTALKKIWLFLLAFLLIRPDGVGAATASRGFEQVKDSVVVVMAFDWQGKLLGLGSGVVLPSGEVASNYHVDKEAVRLTMSR